MAFLGVHLLVSAAFTSACFHGQDAPLVKDLYNGCSICDDTNAQFLSREWESALSMRRSCVSYSRPLGGAPEGVLGRPLYPKQVNKLRTSFPSRQYC